MRGLKVQLATSDDVDECVSKALDKLREAILAWIARAERELAS